MFSTCSVFYHFCCRWSSCTWFAFKLTNVEDGLKMRTAALYMISWTLLFPSPLLSSRHAATDIHLSSSSALSPHTLSPLLPPFPSLPLFPCFLPNSLFFLSFPFSIPLLCFLFYPSHMLLLYAVSLPSSLLCPPSLSNLSPSPRLVSPSLLPLFLSTKFLSLRLFPPPSLSFFLLSLLPSLLLLSCPFFLAHDFYPNMNILMLHLLSSCCYPNICWLALGKYSLSCHAAAAFWRRVIKQLLL